MSKFFKCLQSCVFPLLSGVNNDMSLVSGAVLGAVSGACLLCGAGLVPGAGFVCAGGGVQCAMCAVENIGQVSAFTPDESLDVPPCATRAALRGAPGGAGFTLFEVCPPSLRGGGD
jgi:hypothetical protein